MDYTTQRGILQLIIGVCCLCFSLSMAVRAHRDGGLLAWPLPWRGLVSLWIAAVGWSYLAHGWRWLNHESPSFADWRMVAPLYAVCLMSVWTWFRWMREERKEAA